MTTLKKTLYGIFLISLFASGGCVKNGIGEWCPPPDYEIVISGVADIPANVTFDKVRVNIRGTCREVIDVVEGSYADGMVVLTLPGNIPVEKLQTSIRSGNDDLCGCWLAASDNPDARVASPLDIIAFAGDTRVGRLYLTDWPRTGTTVGKSWIYYHYADRPFTLSGTYGTYRYEASFVRGWNVYRHMNLTEDTGAGTVLCTTSIPPEAALVWRFETGRN